MNTLKTPHCTFVLAQGSEGPRHDPYSYKEIVVSAVGRSVILHTGLVCWLKRDGVIAAEGYEESELAFKELVGFSARQVERFFDERDARRYRDREAQQMYEADQALLRYARG